MTRAEPRERRVDCAGLLAIVVGVIVHGLLLPFQYYDHPWPGGALHYLPSTWQNWVIPNVRTIDSSPTPVMPAKAGIHVLPSSEQRDTWIPAFAGMTGVRRRWVNR